MAGKEISMHRGQMGRRLPLKTVYYLSFLFFIVIPILIVLVVALFVLNKQFKNQALTNIRQAQETVITELKSDIDIMSMRLSHLIYTNNNEILAYAAEMDTADFGRRYEYEQKLQQAGNLALEPVKDIISVGFYMKDGRKTYIKNDINRTMDEIREMDWYQKALEKSNTVCLGSYDTVSSSDLYVGGKKDLLILVFALAPDVSTDRSQKIEMVVFYQSTDAADRIKEYNRNYLEGKNKLGITQIRDSGGNLVFSTLDQGEIDFSGKKYTCVKTPLELKDTVWYLESYIETRDLTLEYWNRAVLVLLAAVLILLLAGYYSRYFLRSIVNPVEEISSGLREVEEGNLDVHVTASGQSEVRNMIHQFNAMVRRLKALIGEYEERVRNMERKPGDYLAALLKKEMTPEEVGQSSRDFFMEPYVLMSMHIVYENPAENEMDVAVRLKNSFERNPRYASRCIAYIENSSFFFAFYRVTEEEYSSRIVKMLQELQRAAANEFGVKIEVCIGKKAFGFEEFPKSEEDVRKKICLRHLIGENAVIDLNRAEEKDDSLLELAKEYERLANALYIADEKNMAEEKNKLFVAFSDLPMAEIRGRAYAVILAIGKRFDRDNSRFSDAFGQQYNYLDKIGRIEDVRSLKLWLTNYFAWLMDYSASKLNVAEADVIVRAKRYMADHYEDCDLSLPKVAEHVGLNEKYFTNRFTKETGENFSSYLTALRMQKAKELLKTTTFKVYEISEMVGYHNVEHFNRMFKKLNGITPARYRKTM